MGSEMCIRDSIGDGKIFVSDVRNIIRIRTGEDGIDALQKSKID